MKKLMLFVVSFLFFTATYAQNLKMEPKHPMPGEKVMLTYDVKDSPLEKVNVFETTVFYFKGDMPEAESVEMTFQEDHYAGEMMVPKDAKAFFVTLGNRNENIYDDNDKMGYGTMLYKEDRKTPVKEAHANMAIAYNTYARIVQIDRNTGKAIELLKEEFAQHPDLKNDRSYMRIFAYATKQANDEEGIKMVEDQIEVLSSKKKGSEDELMLAFELSKALKDEAKQESLSKTIKKKYSKSDLYRTEMMDAFYAAKEVKEKVDIYNEMKAMVGDEEENKGTLENMAGQIARAYAKEKDWTNFEKYLGMISNGSSKAGIYNSIAWNMAGGGLDGEATNIEMAAKFSRASLDNLEKEINELTAKPPYYTKEQWREMMQRSFGMYADTYALALYKKGKNEEALKYQEMACKENDFSDGEMNERYTEYYEAVKGGAKTEILLAKMIKEGNATTRMKEQHKRIFMENMTLEQAYDSYLSSLEEMARAKYIKELQKKMINDEAPDFTLVNLDGESVSLSDLKGKVVVLDFWATWCGPCKASFPGMQKAVDHFESNDDVAFLFIDTWESAQDKEANASDFITSNNYTFNVLMDNKNEVVTKFGVEGIPTKFIIDPDSHIRFKSVGYSGNNEELVEELKLMIEMAGGKTETVGTR